MTDKLLSRDDFRNGVFARDNHKCVFCGEPAVDAHHILERRLFSDGGYYTSNGASVCADHHLKCEMTEISVEDVREACGILKPVLPDHLYDDQPYDKWGNPILPNGQRVRGELFFDESVQKILALGGVLGLFTHYVKYPRTYHLPWSDNVNDDDRVTESLSEFTGKRVIVTQKMDGENCVRGDVLIETSQGEITIAEIVLEKRQVEVLSFNEETNELEYQPIENWIEISETDEWFEIETEDGQIVYLTENHKVFIPKLGVYRKVLDLKEGDNLLILDE